MGKPAIIERLLLSDQLRRDGLQAVADLDLPDCWIGAGFLRDAVWDYLHGHEPSAPMGDVDVVWFCRRSSEQVDRAIEQTLRQILPDLEWSVKNQARMHVRNGDGPYASVTDAMRYWPETATAIAVRYKSPQSVEVTSPFGLDDLFGLILRPGPMFRTRKRQIFEERVASKKWLERYPLLRVCTEPTA